MAEDKISNPVLEITVSRVESGFAGHAGFQHCMVLIETESGETISLQFSKETAQDFQSKLALALSTMERRSTN